MLSHYRFLWADFGGGVVRSREEEKGGEEISGEKEGDGGVCTEVVEPDALFADGPFFHPQGCVREFHKEVKETLIIW